MKRFLKVCFSMLLVMLSFFSLTACGKKTSQVKIDLPETINLTEDEKMPKLKVYDTAVKGIVEMELEDYLLGVVAGEMYNSWHLEALKAQAILARTYTLYYLQNFTSKYEGADISNDVTEAQAYDASRINDNIRKAVAETKGKVILSDDELIESWFHSNSGGVTTTAKNGLNYGEDENYTQVKKSVETAENSENYEWSKTFTKSEVMSALREMGVSVSSISSFAIAEKDDSGRVKKFKVGTSEVDANTFRIKIGSTEMKSTLITDIIVSANSINFAGRGYGHGVGMSQWGAKILAEQGKSAEEIINFYFKDVKIAEYTL
ncbi:MAG: SpoIID/LytB domain-containing protein [Clostridia bacterium]|nr:SpoIID/LytB domain-containing protein [Clostridia bacterium]